MLQMLWTFAAEDPGTPARARAAVRAYAADQGADAHTLAAVELCVSEAVSNAVVHAYRKLGRARAGGGRGAAAGRLPLRLRARPRLRRAAPPRTAPGSASGCR